MMYFYCFDDKYEPVHGIFILIAFTYYVYAIKYKYPMNCHKVISYTCMHSYPVGLEV